MLSVGFDIGSSSVKCSIINIENGSTVASGNFPAEEMEIISTNPGYAEQDPNTWWNYSKTLFKKLTTENKIDLSAIKSIGITYQMHGLVLVDENQKVLRNSIIWCDSRGVDIGTRAFKEIGESYCLNNLLNSPGIFTATKLRWVKENEPDVYKKIHKIMLPGDFIAMKLTGEISTTLSGLSEAIIWDFKSNSISQKVLSYYEIDEKIIPKAYPTFSVQGKVSKNSAAELGLNEDVVVSYRAGDQPNNAFSLNVLNPGEVAGTAGTSGVIYGVIDKANHDEFSRVNPFIHVNHSEQQTRIGVLLCISGTGIQNSWIRKNFGSNLSYAQMNELASKIEIGSDGLAIMPFGNGPERVFQNKNIGGQIFNIDFNRHTTAHLIRAEQEGIAFSFKYGIDILKEMGLHASVIRAGHANMFLSPVFRETLSNITNSKIELYNTDGSQGAARGAAVGAGYYKSFDEAFESLNKIDEVNPNEKALSQTQDAYSFWLRELNKEIKN